ncbi:MAG: hypothetical protein FWE22_02290 [Firmicutes bacterium]|nr:hypothetical protein [Bacillota bacterium]
MKKIKFSVLTMVLALMMVFAVGCGGNIHWLAPMLSIEAETNTASVWDSDYELIRLGTGAFVLQYDGEDVPITEEALIAGGAVRTTVYFSYNGGEDYFVRFAAFAYEFIGHARPATRLTPAQSSSIRVLWRNPYNNQFFCIIQNTIGSLDVTNANYQLTSLRTGNPQSVIRLNRENASDFNQMELFVVAHCTPDLQTRSGYVLTFAFELPDFDNHFHGFNTLVSSSTAIIFEGDCD